MSGRRDYRLRIYRKYVSRGQREVPPFDARASRRRGRYLRRVFKDWLPLDRDAAVADLGCGDGVALRFFKASGFEHLAGVDLSPEQVAIARRLVPDVVEGDVFDFLASRRQAFDLMIALDLIEHLSKEEILPFLEACRRSLRPGGRLILQTPNADSPLGTGIRYGDFTHEVCFNPHSLSWLMKLSGFGALECRELGPQPLGFLSLNRYLLWKLLRLGVELWNLVETGSAGSGVYTRVFLISGVRK